MNLIKRLYGQSSDNLIGHANHLVDSAKLYAIGSFSTASNSYYILLKTNPKDWDFVITVAAVYIAATRLNNLELDDNRQEKLMEIVAKNIREWNRDGINAFEDCRRVYESEYARFVNMTEYQKNNSFLTADALGVWIVLNILQRSPETDEEISLVRATGSMVTGAFFDYWTT